MGNLCCCRKNIKKKIVLLLLGLDNAGKTVAVKGLAGEPSDSVVPTVGFSVVNLNYHSHVVKVFDLGGGPNIRGIWHKYFVDAHGIIFVVDSSDFARIEEAKNVLQDIVTHEKICGKPLLILANKQDNECALDEIDIIEKLNVEFLVNSQQCPTLVESCAAVEIDNKHKIDPGIRKGYEWLLNYIMRNYNSLNKRVEIDVLEQEKVDRQHMLERIEKIKHLKEIELRKKHEEDAIESYSDYKRKLNGEMNQTLSLDVSNYCSLEIDNSSTSENSIETFPPVYHCIIGEDIYNERPKSATEIVKQHIQLSDTSKKSVISKSNKTIPAALYGLKVPHSASERRKAFIRERRNLKSAGDSVFTVTNLPNMVSSTMGPSGDDYQKELFHLNNYDTLSKLPMFTVQNCNGNSKHRNSNVLNGDNSTINVIDME